MAYWLKLIGTSENPLDPVDGYAENHVDSSAHGDEWIGLGDKIILYATAHQVVFATADVISEPYDPAKDGGLRVWIFGIGRKFQLKEGFTLTELETLVTSCFKSYGISHSFQ